MSEEMIRMPRRGLIVLAGLGLVGISMAGCVSSQASQPSDGGGLYQVFPEGSDGPPVYLRKDQLGSYFNGSQQGANQGGDTSSDDWQQRAAEQDQRNREFQQQQQNQNQ